MPDSLLLKNGLIVTMDQDRSILNGSILVEGNEIRKVGDFDGDDANEVFDLEGKIILPGLVCAHSRLSRILLQSASFCTPKLSDYQKLLHQVYWPADDKLTEEDVYVSSKMACLRFIKTGTTFFAGVHSSQESIGKSLNQVASAVEESGLRASLGFLATERHTRAEGAKGMRESVRFLENKQKERLEENRIQGMVCVSGSEWASDELLGHGKRVADRFDVPMIISGFVGKSELYHSLREHGKRTVERFRDIGILNSRTILTQGIGLNSEDIAALERNHSKVVNTPVHDMRNGMGVARVSEMLEEEIDVGMGNLGYNFDGFENIRILHLLLRLNSEESCVISPMKALEMATIGGARLYGMENKIGSIEPGKRADLIVINPSNSSTPVRPENVVKHIVDRITGSDVETVLVGGNFLMKDGHINTLDEKKVMEKSKRKASKLWKKIEAIKG